MPVIALDTNILTAPWNIISGTGMHFKSRAEAQEAVERAIESGDLNELGKALHMLQDSYSHENTTWWKHMWTKEPDMYDSSSIRDQQMQQKIKEYMDKFLEKNPQYRKKK